MKKQLTTKWVYENLSDYIYNWKIKTNLDLNNKNNKVIFTLNILLSYYVDKNQDLTSEITIDDSTLNNLFDNKELEFTKSPLLAITELEFIKVEYKEWFIKLNPFTFIDYIRFKHNWGHTNYFIKFNDKLKDYFENILE